MTTLAGQEALIHMFFCNAKRVSTKLNIIHTDKQNSFVIHEAACQTPKERHLHAIQGICVPVRAPSQPSDENQIEHQKHVAYDLGPAEDDVQQEERTEHQSALPGVESHVVALLLENQEHYASSWW